MAERNPRFCGVELLPMAPNADLFEGQAHGAEVRVWRTPKGWLSSAYFSFYGIEIREDLHSASWRQSLLSLRGRIRNLRRSLLPFEPQPKRSAKR